MPLRRIIDKALLLTSFVYDGNKSDELQRVLLCLLGVTDSKGKNLPNINDGHCGWYRLGSNEKRNSLCEDIYRSVEQVVLEKFPDDDCDGGHMKLLADNMTDCLITWSKSWRIPSDIWRDIFVNGHFYILCQNDIEEMIKCIRRSRLHNGRTEDKNASACIEILVQITKANSLLPKGYNDSQQDILDKVFNIKNAGLGSVAYHEDFYVPTSGDEDNNNEKATVTPEKVENTVTATPNNEKANVTPEKVENTVTATQKKKNCHKRFTERDVDVASSRKKVKNFFDDVNDNDGMDDRDVMTDDNEEDNKGSDEKEREYSSPTQKKDNILSQRYVGKSSILAMIAAQAPVLQRNPGEENRKRLQVIFTTPIRQAKGTYKVAMFIDSIDGRNENQIYTWKAKPLIHALSLTRNLEGLYLGDQKDSYTNPILQALNKYMPIRKHPGESNDDIKKRNGAYLFQAGGILELRFPSIDKKDIDEELDHVVQAFRKIISDANFHEAYSLGAARSFIEQYKNNDVFVEHVQALIRTGKAVNYSLNKLADDIYMDKEEIFKNIKDLYIEVIKDCPLDMLLRNSDIKEFGRALFGGYYSDAYASIVFKNPRGKNYNTL